MNEQAIQDAYKLFVEQGYGKSIDDFKKLISTNPDALNDSYNLFKSQGYAKSIDEYKGLMGVSSQPQPKVEVKKKEQPIPLEPQLDTPTPQGTMDLSLEDSLLASQKPKEKDYFTGAFGDVLRGLDKIVPIGIGDFVDDMYLATNTVGGRRHRRRSVRRTRNKSRKTTKRYKGRRTYKNKRRYTKRRI